MPEELRKTVYGRKGLFGLALSEISAPTNAGPFTLRPVERETPGRKGYCTEKQREGGRAYLGSQRTACERRFYFHRGDSWVSGSG